MGGIEIRYLPIVHFIIHIARNNFVISGIRCWEVECLADRKAPGSCPLLHQFWLLLMLCCPERNCISDRWPCRAVYSIFVRVMSTQQKQIHMDNSPQLASHFSINLLVNQLPTLFLFSLLLPHMDVIVPILQGPRLVVDILLSYVLQRGALGLLVQWWGT